MELVEKSKKIFGEPQFYTILDHVSKSGMQRRISVFMPLLDEEGKPYMACVARERKIRGCGMDMGFALVYDMVGLEEPFSHYWL